MDDDLALAGLEDVVLLALLALRDDVHVGGEVLRLHRVDDGLQSRLAQVLSQEALLEAVEQLQAVFFTFREFGWCE